MPVSQQYGLRAILFLGAALLGSPPGVAAQVPPADEIVLQNGSRIVGTVTSSRDGKITVDTDFAGTVTIDAAQIVSMQTREPVTLMLADKTVVRDQPLHVEGQQLVISDAGGVSRLRPLQDLMLLNPQPWELGEGYRWTGLASVALTSQRGNTDSDELDYKTESVWRSQRDRYTAKFYGEFDETNNVRSADNWHLVGKYDYFLAESYYWGLNALAEKDKFADLDLRSLLGPYVGRQFYNRPVFALSGELGVSYVNQQFNVAPDEDYAAANWTLNLSSNYLSDKSRLYIDHTGIWNMQSPSDLILNTTFGLSFPLMWHLEAAAEVLLEYDSGAVANVEKLDQSYKFRIGYTW